MIRPLQNQYQIKQLNLFYRPKFAYKLVNWYNSVSPLDRFGFHQPPLNSVNHLHLHCLALPYVPRLVIQCFLVPICLKLLMSYIVFHLLILFVELFFFFFLISNIVCGTMEVAKIQSNSLRG